MNTIEQILVKINDRLEEIEILVVDDRKLLTKLIHQVDHITDVFKEFISTDSYNDDIFDVFQLMTREMNSLKKLEKELKKYEKKLTPGIMGES
tara:strand:- start:215 stop:493 length:279 start_codon:yes stop_codon:yes gene_type:complete